MDQYDQNMVKLPIHYIQYALHNQVIFFYSYILKVYMIFLLPILPPMELSSKYFTSNLLLNSYQIILFLIDMILF